MNFFKKRYYALFNIASDLVAGLTLFRIQSNRLLPLTNKNVISFSLYGHDERYFSNIDDCIGSYKKLFSDWIIRVYISKDIPASAIQKLRNYNCELITMSGTGIDHRYMFWRFLVFDDIDVTRAMARDIDSVASIREKNMVDAWITSKKKMHIIRDHPYHQSLVMGGLWGLLTNGKPYRIKSKMIQFKKKWNGYGVDQEFLNRLYQENEDNVFINDIYIRFENEKPVITPHDDSCFYIGEVNRNNSDLQQLRNKLMEIYHQR